MPKLMYKDNIIGGSMAGVPVGAILPYAANLTIPYGFLYCEGQAVSRTMYPDLFALIGTTYGAGDGSTTFNLPNLLGKYPQGDTTAGTVKAAGLPNIEGTLNTRGVGTSRNIYTGGYDGALSYEAKTSAGAIGISDLSNTTSYGQSVFDASKSNSIYGNSDTVTPPTLTVRWIIKAYDAPTPSSAQIDLSQYASDLAARLTREQTPAFNKRDVITVSGTYTAPVTGWYRIVVKGGGGGGQGARNDTGLGNYAAGGGGGEGGTTIAYEYMTAGDTAIVVIGAGGTAGAANGAAGGSGGNTTVTVNGNTYTGGGANGGQSLSGGQGGTGTITGASGQSGKQATLYQYNVSGGGAGGAHSRLTPGVKGGGGGGGDAASGGATAGSAGGDGFVWFEYFDGSLNP